MICDWCLQKFTTGRGAICDWCRQKFPAGVFILEQEKSVEIGGDLREGAIAKARLAMSALSVPDQIAVAGDFADHKIEGKAGHPEFYAILAEMAALHDRKAKDYGSGSDPLHNVRSGGAFANVPAWVAAMMRANDKMVRLQSLIRNGSLANESAEDSLLDIANYSILGLILMREGSKK